VAHVWVEGEHLVRDRQLTRASYAGIRTAYSYVYEDFWTRVQTATKVT